jgi:hypothetical protein
MFATLVALVPFVVASVAAHGGVTSYVIAGMSKKPLFYLQGTYFSVQNRHYLRWMAAIQQPERTELY